MYSRILLKLSGAFLGGAEGKGIDFGTAGRLCDQLTHVHALGAELGIVIGGGNILRGVDTEDTGLERTTRDSMGMLATVINALALAGVLELRGVPACVLTATDMSPVAESFSRARALAYLQQGRTVLFAGGTGHPFFTTDTAAALRALQIGADVLMKGTDVDGVFTADPDTHPDATLYETLDYTTVLKEGLRAMDATSIALCREHGLPVLVFNLGAEDSIIRAVKGERLGTLIQQG